MKVTYTAHDQSNWESEVECIGWEKFLELKEAAELKHQNPEDLEPWDTEFKQFLDSIAGLAGSSFYSGFEDIWKQRKHLYELVDLMKAAERSTEVKL